MIDNEYALWRTETLNFSIRKTVEGQGTLRHVGWEDSQAENFTSAKDSNGILWEHFSAEEQADEIYETWPQVKYKI